MLKRLRGMFGTAVVWAGTWAAVGGVTGLISMAGVLKHIFQPQYTGAVVRLVLRVAGSTAVSCAVMGAISGWVFAAALTALERRRTLVSISVGRVAVWGVIGGLAVPALLRLLPFQSALTQLYVFSLHGLGFSATMAGVLGGVSAAGSLLLARRGPRANGMLGEAQGVPGIESKNDRRETPLKKTVAAF